MVQTNKTLLLLALALLGLLSQPSFADLSQDLMKCRSIQSQSARLACYDGLNVNNAAQSSSEPAVTKTQPAPAAPTTNLSTPALAQVPATPKVSKTAENAKPKLEQNIDTFGEPSSHGIQSIQSKMVGQFKRWKKGMLLHLENGQVWKVLNNKSSYKKLDNPLITISKGVFGSFDAKVEGLNARAKVKRIK